MSAGSTPPVQDPALIEEKKALRRRVRDALAMVTPEERAAWSGAVCRHLIRLALERAGAGGVAMVFVPMAEEVDLGDFVRGWTALGGRIAVPRVEWTTREMTPVGVAGLPSGEATPGWIRGRGGVLEPDAGAVGVAGEEIRVVVTPGLAFDRAGNRLGRGAGFYDRFLSRSDLRRAAKIGVAFDVQVVPRVPIFSGDVAMDGVVTPAGDIVRR